MYYGYEDFEEENNKKVKTVCVKHINLLYDLSDSNLLEYLVNVSTDKNNPDNRVWIFQHNVAVQDVINSYYSGLNRKIKTKKSEERKNDETNYSIKSNEYDGREKARKVFGM